jgi:hypothetical protein
MSAWPTAVTRLTSAIIRLGMLPKAASALVVFSSLVHGCDWRPVEQASVSPERLRTTDATTHEGLRLIYVPAYEYAVVHAGTKIRLTTTLTIHNVSRTTRVTVHSVDYYNSAGTLVQDCLHQPRDLGPFETLEVVVDDGETSGGISASFLVGWDGAGAAHGPLVEALMVGNSGSGAVTFTTRGVAVVP